MSKPLVLSLFVCLFATIAFAQETKDLPPPADNAPAQETKDPQPPKDNPPAAETKDTSKPATEPAPAPQPSQAAVEAKDSSKAVDRVESAGTVLDEIQNAPDNRIPEEVLGSAECVAVVPSLLKGGFIFGARYGRGVATCRLEKGWSAPAFFTISGGSFGLQIGGQAVDLVMLIMNKNGMDHLLSSQFKLGADASAAAGPVGRHASADTDWKMRAEVLTYSRARGLFAGLELAGAVIKQDKNTTRDFYGRMVPFKTALRGNIEAPQNAYPFLNSVAKWAQEAQKK